MKGWARMDGVKRLDSQIRLLKGQVAELRKR
jgi:hypothetical protein